MPNRYCRDELIKIALDMAQLPTLEVQEMPDGVVRQGAHSIQWLQDILDFWYHMVPFSATVVKTPLNCTAHSDTIILPSDFILDVKNGYLVQKVPGDTQSLARAGRVPLQKMINRQLSNQRANNVNYPYWYAVIGDDGVVTTQYQTMKIAPTPTISTQGYLWYYKLPPTLDASQKPKFPNDYVCIEYLRIRANEYMGLIEIGTAQKFCEKIIGSMKAAGLMNEPEDDEIPFDTQVIHGVGVNTHTYSWMGPV